MVAVATILAFHAHPDDEVMTTGGTLARLAAEGHRVIIVMATDGVVNADEADGSGAEDPFDRLAVRVLMFGFVTRDVIEYGFAYVRVVADDDEHGRRLVAGPVLSVLFPEAIAGFIVAIKAVKCPLKLDGDLRLARDGLGLPPLAR